MSAHRIEARTDRFNTIFTALASRQRRFVLELLEDRCSPVDELELATFLAAQSEGRELVEVTPEDRDRAHFDLRQRVLPVLGESDLVDRRAEGVTTTDHPLVGHPEIRRILEADPPGDLLRSLADGRRRDACAILATEGPSVDNRILARLIAAREYDVDPDDVPDQVVDDVLASVHHVHLPVLEDAGLLEYDHERGNVTYTGHPALEETALDRDGRVAVTASSA